MNRLYRALQASFLIAILPACSGTEEAGSQAAAPSNETIERLGRGEAIAETLCATCHAVGTSGESQHADAVPLRRLSWKYPVRSLERPLSEGIVVGHPDMPEWQFEKQDIDALLAYLESIQEARPV